MIDNSGLLQLGVYFYGFGTYSWHSELGAILLLQARETQAVRQSDKPTVHPDYQSGFIWK